MAETSAMELILTEVTNMNDSQVCVAGWCTAANRMVRPLSGPRHHWAEALATPELLAVGNIVTIAASFNPSVRRLPHAREDYVVSARPAFEGQIKPDALIAVLSPSESPSVDALFGGHLIEGRFVREGSDCASLGAIRLNSRRMRFEERPRELRPPQLRCWFYDPENARYNFPVVSRALQSIFATDGLGGVEALRAESRQAHMRIGLAHPFDDGRAYAMVNHVLFD
jgi:hypothetical protein